MCLLIVVFVSCKVMYRPTMQSVPMFRGKGAGHATLGYRNAALAYAVSDKFGLTANGYFRDGSFFTLSNEYTSNYASAQKSLSINAVFYAVKPRSSFEFLVGTGWGESSISYRVGGGFGNGHDARTHANFGLLILQPNFVQHRGDFDYAFSTRLAIMSFFNYREYPPGTKIQPAPGTVFFEPAFTLRWKKRWFGMFFQAQTSLALSNSEDWGAIHYAPYRSMISMTGGLQFHLVPPSEQ